MMAMIENFIDEKKINFLGQKNRKNLCPQGGGAISVSVRAQFKFINHHTGDFKVLGGHVTRHTYLRPFERVVLIV